MDLTPWPPLRFRRGGKGGLPPWRRGRILTPCLPRLGRRGRTTVARRGSRTGVVCGGGGLGGAEAFGAGDAAGGDAGGGGGLGRAGWGAGGRGAGSAAARRLGG